MHKASKHSKGYDFEALTKVFPKLSPFVFTNQYGNVSIDFSDAKAVKALNSALLKWHYNIEYWEFPDHNLCPPIPGRMEYILLLNDVLQSSGLKTDITILDVGTGATCIYPLLGHSEFGWRFIASEADKKAFENAQRIVRKNDLESHIELRFQSNQEHILESVLSSSEQLTATMCNPPFFKSKHEAEDSTKRKLKGLGNTTEVLQRNFSGTANELWYPGGEKAFLHNYLYQSSKLKTSAFWFTSLVSKKEHVKSMELSLKKLGATQFKVLNFSLGNKKSRVVAWSFLNEDEQKQWL